MARFNLVGEGWIPCLMPNGGLQELGLRDCLAKSHEIKEIYDPSPLVTLSLHRLLLAILHRNFGPENLNAWLDLWKQGRWNSQILEKYFAEWHQRFDLFDERYPFYQDIRLTEEGKKDQYVPLAKLARELSATRNATLFDHSVDAESHRQKFSPAEAARLVLVDQYYALRDGSGYASSPLSSGLALFVRGDTLFETLMFNLVIYNDQRPMPRVSTEDPPNWEREEPTQTRNAPSAYIDYLTWPHRRLLLLQSIGEEAITTVIRQASRSPGYAEWKKNNFDPIIHYFPSDQTGYTAIGLKEEKEVWRDSGVLFALALQHRPHMKAPDFVSLLARGNNEVLVLSAIGVSADNNSVSLWRHERLPLPLQYLDNEGLVDALREALNCTEQVGNLLRPGFVKMNGSKWPTPMLILASEALSGTAGRKPDQKDVVEICNALAPERLYWSRLEVPFKNLIVNLPDDSTKEDGDVFYGRNHCLSEWAEVIRKHARGAFEKACDALGTSARALRASALARRAFQGQMRRILEQYLEEREEVESV